MKARPRLRAPYPADSFAERHVSDIADLLRQAAQALQAAEGLFAKGDGDSALEIMIDRLPAVQEAITLMKLGAIAAIHPYGSGD